MRYYEAAGEDRFHPCQREQAALYAMLQVQFVLGVFRIVAM
jgi:hypothetical protein